MTEGWGEWVLPWRGYRLQHARAHAGGGLLLISHATSCVSMWSRARSGSRDFSLERGHQTPQSQRCPVASFAHFLTLFHTLKAMARGVPLYLKWHADMCDLIGMA